MRDPQADKKATSEATPVPGVPASAVDGIAAIEWSATGKASEAAASAAASAAAAAAAAGRRRASVPRVRPRQIVWLVIVVLLFTLGMVGSIILWQTRMWDDFIDYQVTIRNDTDGYKKWANSDVTSTINYYLFNYTNVEEFLAGNATKLKLEEVGPYAFREHTQRVNDVFHSNGTVSYNERKTYTFIPEMSKGSLSDNITNLHVLFLSLSYISRRMTYFERLPVWSFVKVMEPKAIVTRTAKEWFWGYNDAVKAFVELREGTIKAGLLESVNGTSKDRLTVHTGVGDIDKLGIITHYNGKDLMNFYNKEECNRINGSDGVRFPPTSIREGATLLIYHREACRRVPIVYVKDVTVWDGVPAQRFSAPNNLFDNGDDSPENACYCQENFYDKCYPSGALNTKNCQKGVPLFVSFPHFLNGDKWYLEKLEGLNPDPQRHSMHIDIHQRIGATVGISSRFQMNFLIDNFLPNEFMEKMNGRILPFAWFDRIMDEWPDNLRATFRMMSFTVPVVHGVLRWSCPILAVITGIVLLICLYVEVAALLRPGPYDQDLQMTRL